MYLHPLSENLPAGAIELLEDLGEGENGFSGRPPCTTAQEFVEHQKANSDPANLPADRMPQWSYFLLDDRNVAVGFVKIRPMLNARLLAHGGNVGYYIKKDERGKGYGNAALRLVLENLRGLGVQRCLATARVDNTRSNSVIRNNGGVLEGNYLDPDGVLYNRWWIEIN